MTSILEGIIAFRHQFIGELVTKTMQISGITNSVEVIYDLCDDLYQLQPVKSYRSIPLRPAAESWVKPPNVDSLDTIFQIISKEIPFMDLLFETEASDFTSTGNLGEDILSITAVQPLREEALQKMVIQANADWKIVEALVLSGKISKFLYRDEWFYVRS